MTAAEVLELFKTDMGITITKRDAYFSALIEGAQKELARKGVVIDYDSTDDVFLLVDYSAWTYRSRTDGAPLPNNLQLRIRNRIIRNRSEPD